MREIARSHSPYVVYSKTADELLKGTADRGSTGAARKQGILSAALEADEECSAVHDGMEVMHVAAETATSFGAASRLDGIGAGAGAAGFVSGMYFGVTGAQELKKAIQEKNVTAGFEAGGHLLQAGEAVVDTARLAVQSSAVASMVGPTAAGILQSPVMKGLGTGLGMAHGLIESGVGVKELYDGVKENNRSHIITGLLDIASGAAVAAIALGGGPVAGVALAATFGFQMLRVHLLKH